MNTSRAVFIQTNAKQQLGALLAKFAIEEHLPKDSPIRVNIIRVEEVPAFRAFIGKTYLRRGRPVTYDPDDLQSFTLTRLMPPELMGFTGTAVVIDPDIFALADVTPLFEMDMGTHAVLACPKKDAWDTSVMVLDNARLAHWKISDILARLADKSADYDDIIRLTKESSVGALGREWNRLDELLPGTKLLHTTNRLTQPWKTGLPIDFTINPLPKILGIIPREPIHKFLGKYPTRYQPHPDKDVERFFFTLLKRAYDQGVVSKTMLGAEMAAQHIRTDLLSKLGSTK